MRVYIPVEITSRELEAKTFLACCAAQAGFEVIIGQIDMIRRFAKMSEPGIFYDKSLHSEYPHLYRCLKRMGYRIAVNDEEGLVVDDDQYRDFGVSCKIDGVVDVIFAWGEKQKRLISDALPCFCGEVILAGNPRIDILRPEFRAFHQKNVDKIKQTHGDFLLINTRFGFYNNVIGGEAYRKKIIRGECGDKIEYLLRYYDFDAKLFEEFAEMIKVLSKRYPKKKIILRPHPSENIETWRAVLSDLDNVLVIREGNVHAWILASSLVIHNGCSTAIESLLLDVPCISFRPIVAQECDIELPNLISLNVYSYGELCACLDDVNYCRQRMSRVQWVRTLKEHIHSVDGDMSVKITVDGLLQLSQGKRKIDYGYCAFQKINAILRHGVRVMRVMLREGRKNDRSKPNAKWAKCSVDELRESIKELCFYRHEFANLDVNRIYYDCFRIVLNK
jgi:surface carbohydrate biosynthesis protein